MFSNHLCNYLCLIESPFPHSVSVNRNICDIIIENFLFIQFLYQNFCEKSTQIGLMSVLITENQLLQKVIVYQTSINTVKIIMFRLTKTTCSKQCPPPTMLTDLICKLQFLIAAMAQTVRIFVPNALATTDTIQITRKNQFAKKLFYFIKSFCLKQLYLHQNYTIISFYVLLFYI